MGSRGGAPSTRLHVYTFTRPHASRGAALWNEFEIAARGASIDVVLNREQVSRLEHGSREPRGHVALQAHHEESQVQFRNVAIRVLEKG